MIMTTCVTNFFGIFYHVFTLKSHQVLATFCPNHNELIVRLKFMGFMLLSIKTYIFVSPIPLDKSTVCKHSWHILHVITKDIFWCSNFDSTNVIMTF